MADKSRSPPEPPDPFERERLWKALAARARALAERIVTEFPVGIGPEDVVASETARTGKDAPSAGRKRAARRREALLSGELDWSPFFLEGPVGFRETLPVLLEASLDDFPAREDLMIGATLLLRPKLQLLALGDDDSFFRERAEALTPGERACVADYLALLVDLEIGVSFLAAKALSWGEWAEIGTEARVSLDRFLSAVQAAPPVQPSEPQAARAVEAIREGFARTADPVSCTICEDEFDQPSDPKADISLEFNALRWDGLRPDYLHYHAHALEVLNNEAFRFFLPAFLIADIVEPLGNYDPLAALATRTAETPPAELFDAAERRAITAYLRFKATEAEEQRRATALLRRFVVEG